MQPRQIPIQHLKDVIALYDKLMKDKQGFSQEKATLMPMINTAKAGDMTEVRVLDPMRANVVKSMLKRGFDVPELKVESQRLAKEIFDIDLVPLSPRSQQSFFATKFKPNQVAATTVHTPTTPRI